MKVPGRSEGREISVSGNTTIGDNKADESDDNKATEKISKKRGKRRRS